MVTNTLFARKGKSPTSHCRIQRCLLHFTPESSETISNKKNSTEKHPERWPSSLFGSDDVATPQIGDSYSFSSELTCINLPFTATKGDTVLLLHVWMNHLPQWRCLFQNLWRLTCCQMGAWWNLKKSIFDLLTENPYLGTIQTSQMTEVCR